MVRYAVGGPSDRHRELAERHRPTFAAEHGATRRIASREPLQDHAMRAGKEGRSTQGAHREHAGSTQEARKRTVPCIDSTHQHFAVRMPPPHPPPPTLPHPQPLGERSVRWYLRLFTRRHRRIDPLEPKLLGGSLWARLVPMALCSLCQRGRY